MFTAGSVDFGAVIAWKMPLLRKALAAFRRSSPGELAEFESFCVRHLSWLEEFALFMALKEAHGQAIWTEWPRELALREPAALDERARSCATRSSATSSCNLSSSDSGAN